MFPLHVWALLLEVPRVSSAATVPTSPFAVTWGGRETLRYTFEVVRLWEIPAERVLDTNAYDLWPLATLMAGATVQMAVSVAERIAEAPLPLGERSELTGLLVVLSELRLGRREVLQALRRNPMIDELVKQSSLAEEFFEEGKSEGISQGIGLGLSQAVRLALEGRFGELSPDLLTALESADTAKLQEVAKHAGTDTLEQIRARLGLG